MSIRTTATARSYRAGQVRERQVRFALDGRWRWRELDSGLAPVREGTCDERDLPPAIAGSARGKRDAGVSPLWVRWPL